MIRLALSFIILGSGMGGVFAGPGFLEKLAKPVVKETGSFFENKRVELESNIRILEDAAHGRIDHSLINPVGRIERSAEETKQAVESASREAKKAAENIAREGKKAFDDYIRTLKKAASDVVDAAKAAGHYVEFQINGFRHTLSAAERRVRQGKVVDAIFHFHTDQWQSQSDGAFAAAEESDLIKTAMSSAASTYGGPAGAAAFAAWYAYNKTGGNVDAALRVGMLTGLQSYAIPAVSELPEGTAGELIKKAVVSGAIGGVAVAAEGGDSNAVRDAFIKQGGMVIVRAGQSFVTKQYDAATAETDTFCASAIGTECKPTLDAVARDKEGNVALDARGAPRVINNRLLESRRQLGTWGNAIMKPAVPELPDVKALSVAGNDWSISWDRGILTSTSANLPGVALTYVGLGSPFQRKVRELEARSDPSNEQLEMDFGENRRRFSGIEPPIRMALSPTDDSGIELVLPKRGKALLPVKVGDILKVVGKTDTLRRGALYVVTEAGPYSECGPAGEHWIRQPDGTMICYSPPPVQVFYLDLLRAQ